MQNYESEDVPIRYLEDYEMIALKGEGRSSYVVYADKAAQEINQKRVVWRFPKGDTNTLNTSVAYIRDHIRPAIDIPSTIRLPSLIRLHSTLRLKSEHRSMIPLSNYALELEDYTVPQIKINTGCVGMNMAVEIKPKQLSLSPGTYLHDVPFCMNCLLQTQKWFDGKYEKLYHFCPLDIASGDKTRVCDAVKSLIVDPHNNMKIFVNGHKVLDSEHTWTIDSVHKVLPQSIFDSHQFLDGLTNLLMGNDNQNVFAALAKAQCHDKLGPLQMYTNFVHLPGPIQTQLLKIDSSYDLLFNMKSNEERQVYSSIFEQLRRYTVAATLRDCSVIYSIQCVDSRINSNTLESEGCLHVPITDTPYSWIASTHLIDLDCKPLVKLKQLVHRLTSAADIIAGKYSNDYVAFRKPCTM